MSEHYSLSRTVIRIAALAVVGVAAARADAPSGPGHSFVADRRALAQGDVLTVLVVESASATTEASTRTTKEESVNANLTRGVGDRDEWGVGWDRDYSGGGRIERTGRLLARITATVVAIDASGQLVLRGQQEISVNDETQRIVLNGTVRPEDVAADNTVPSWRLNNAEIEFVGRGVLGRAQRPGLIARILGFLGID